MDKRLIFLIVGILLIASVILVLKKCSNSEKISKPSFTIQPRDIKEGDSIMFKDETKGAARWKWNFGDGEQSAYSSGSHHYISAGKYSVTLEVYGGFGKIVDSSVIITVSPRISDVPVASFSIEGPTTAIVGEKVTFSCNTPNVTKYLWRSDETGRTDNTQKVTYTFMNPGTTRINLNVVMADNSQGSKFIDVLVKNKPLPAGAKPPPHKPTAEIEADIIKTLQHITDPAYDGEMPPEYYDMIKKYFCGNQQIIVNIAGRQPKDINSYCTWLYSNKGTQIITLNVTLNAENCIEHVAVTQK